MFFFPFDGNSSFQVAWLCGPISFIFAWIVRCHAWLSMLEGLSAHSCRHLCGKSPLWFGIIVCFISPPNRRVWRDIWPHSDKRTMKQCTKCPQTFVCLCDWVDTCERQMLHMQMLHMYWTVWGHTVPEEVLQDKVNFLFIFPWENMGEHFVFTLWVC